MVGKEEIAEGQKLLNTIIQKSWDNQEFKNQLINNPEKTIIKEIGNDNKKDDNLFLENQKIIVEDQTDVNIIYLNIPRNINDLELTDEQLENVSGGDISLGAVAATVIVLGSLAIVCYGVGYAVGYYNNK